MCYSIANAYREIQGSVVFLVIQSFPQSIIRFWQSEMKIVMNHVNGSGMKDMKRNSQLIKLPSGFKLKH